MNNLTFVIYSLLIILCIAWIGWSIVKIIRISERMRILKILSELIPKTTTLGELELLRKINEQL